MKNLIFFSGKFPSNSAGAKRVSYYKEGLDAMGLKTEIVGIDMLPFGAFGYYLDMFIFPIRAVIKIVTLSGYYNNIILYGFNWLSCLLICIYGLFSKKRIYLEVNEKPGSVYSNKLTEMKLSKWFICNMTYFSYKFLDGFLVISDNLSLLISKYKKYDAKVIKIPIIIDLQRGQNHLQDNKFSKKFILHTGALSDRKDGIIEVFQAFAIANKRLNNDLDFYLTSKIAPKEVLSIINQIVQKNNLQNNVHFLGNISEDELLYYQKNCSLVIINKHSNEQNLFNFPTKLGEYLALGIPVLSTGIGEIGNFLVDNENSIIFKEHNIEDLANKITFTINNPEFAKKIGENGRITAKKYFDHNLQGIRLSNFLKND